MLMAEDLRVNLGDFLRGDGQGQQPDQPPFVDGLMERNYPVEDFGGNSITATNKCLTTCARKLCIYEAGFKLRHPDVYDIGGTYKEENPEALPIPETWFFFSTTICPGGNYLLNLFVCHRTTGSFSVGISNGNEISHTKKKDKGAQSWLPDGLAIHKFRSIQPNENYHIKTFCFNEHDVKSLEGTTLLYVPIKIETEAVSTLNAEVIKKIKLKHDFADVLSKQDKTDCVLISASKRQYPVHKIFLAAHSAVLRELIKSTKDGNIFIDINDNDIEWLLEFIYTGTIRNILNKDCVRILQLADRFKLTSLFFLTQFALGDQINVENAVDIACIAEHYNLEKLQTIVFTFIKDNPKVLETEGWKNLDDVNLAKKLFQYMHTKRD